MTANTTPAKPQIPMSRVWKVGLVAVVASVIVNLIIWALAMAILDLPSNFPPLQPGAIAFFTALFTIIAVIVFAIVVKVSGNPIRTYRIVGVIALVISILPNLAMFFNPGTMPPPFDTATTAATIILIVFHIAAAIITIGLLTTRTVEES